VSRRRQSLIEDAVVATGQLPFWASILCAAAVYLGLRFLPPLFAGSSLSGQTLARFFPTIAPWFAVAILGAGLIGVGKRWWRRFLLSRATGLPALRQMAWTDFELLVGEAYRRQGYAVKERGGRQADGGIDLELTRDGVRIVVQCKHWMNRQVPVQRVRELLGALTADGADRGILVATGGFTREARAFAARQPIDLLDGEALIRLMSGLKLQSRELEGQASVANKSPACPQCGKPMVRRTIRRGPKIGTQFWGCVSFPGCRGTRAA
jgi:restriction system protein